MVNDCANLGLRVLEPTLEPWRTDGSSRAVAVLMSGGVDSSTTALLLQQAGWRVLGVTMNIPVAKQCSGKTTCCGAEAGLVAHQLGICHYYIDVTEAFERLVIEPFRLAYTSGRTPNPCMDCNTFLKFDRVWNFLENTFGVRHLATGHYARVVDQDGVARLSRAEDRQKDQSYFLYGMARDRLSRLLLPLGSLSKPQVRELARGHKLPVAQRPESMELCFAGEGNYRRALNPESDGHSGPIFDLSGNLIGQHTGIANYTIGQRRGLGIAAGQPVYVVRINPIENSVTIGSIVEACRRRVTAERMNILSPDQLFSGARLYGKIRSTGEPAGCVVVRLDERVISVDFDEPVFAPTPGQHLVLYDEAGQVVAGGTLFTAGEPDRDEYVSCEMNQWQG